MKDTVIEAQARCLIEDRIRADTSRAVRPRPPSPSPAAQSELAVTLPAGASRLRQ